MSYLFQCIQYKLYFITLNIINFLSPQPHFWPHVPGATCGHEKAKISIAVTVSADGYVLPAMVIIPRKTPLPNYIPPNNVIVQYKENSKTFDSDVISNGVLQRIIYP